MAVSISFFLVYSKKKIARERLYETPVSVRAHFYCPFFKEKRKFFSRLKEKMQIIDDCVNF